MTQPLLDILMITYNRPSYTERTLPQLLETCDISMRVWVWHNGNDAETLAVVQKYLDHPRFHHLEHCPENKQLREPTNWFWKNSTAPYVSKVDDDCLLPNGWAQSLLAAHESNPELGAIGCWRFYDEDFLPAAANRKIVQLKGKHKLMRNAWVQGSGYVMRRRCIEVQGPIREKESYTSYCIRAAISGWQHGWYYPFIHEEHMDDPRSPYCEIKSDADFLVNRPLSAVFDNVTSLAQWRARVKYMAQSVQLADPDPMYHTGWRRKIQKVKFRLLRSIGLGEPMEKSSMRSFVRHSRLVLIRK